MNILSITKRSRTRILRPLALFITPLLVSCASLDPAPSQDRVSEAVLERSGQEIVWQVNAVDQQAAIELLSSELTLDDAVRLALLTSPALQAQYQQLGVAHAELVQAGLMRNPVFHATYLEGHGEEVFDIGVELDFLDVFLIPLRKRQAQASQLETELAVTETVIRRISEVRQAWINAVGAHHLLARERDVQTLLLSMDELSEALFEAGNITSLEREQISLMLAQSRIRIEEATFEAANAEEALAVMIGAWGEEITWQIPDRLPKLPTVESTQGAFETEVVTQNLGLEISRQNLTVAAVGLEIADRERLIPSLEVGWSAEKEEGEWKNGPAVAFALPILDTGRAANAAQTARIESMRRAYLQQEIEVRAEARKAHRELLMRRGVVEHMLDQVFPLAANQQDELILYYHATEVGIQDLLESRLEFAQLGQDFVSALASYWQAREQHSALMQGVIISPAMQLADTTSAPVAASKGGH